VSEQNGRVDRVSTAKVESEIEARSWEKSSGMADLKVVGGLVEV
jgi:hypothetical protein